MLESVRASGSLLKSELVHESLSARPKELKGNKADL